MKITRIDAHDRFLEFSKQADYISQGCKDCIRNRPKEFETHPFYIYAHKRTIELDERIGIFNADWRENLLNPHYIRKYQIVSDVPTSRLIWIPRLSKPRAEPNSMLFKAFPPGDVIKTIWIIPEPEMWNQYTKGKIAENSVICESIKQYKADKSILELSEDDDLPEIKQKQIYKEIARNKKNGK